MQDFEERRDAGTRDVVKIHELGRDSCTQTDPDPFPDKSSVSISVLSLRSQELIWYYLNKGEGSSGTKDHPPLTHSAGRLYHG